MGEEKVKFTHCAVRNIGEDRRVMVCNAKDTEEVFIQFERAARKDDGADSHSFIEAGRFFTRLRISKEASSALVHALGEVNGITVFEMKYNIREKADV